MFLYTFTVPVIAVFVSFLMAVEYLHLDVDAMCTCCLHLEAPIYTNYNTFILSLFYGVY